MYPSTAQGENLFVALARDGGTHAVKYLYDNGRDDLELINGAFLVAAQNGSTGAIDFLLETGSISSEVIDEAFVAAGGSVLRAKTVSFLYEKKRATSEAINKVFASTHCFAVRKLLYENEVIPTEAIIAAFQRATLYGIGHFFRLTKDKLDTVRLLCELGCIPAGVIGKAYSDAATRHLTQIMELLRDHPKLSREVRESAFANAASAGYLDLLRTMYDVNFITPDALLTAFLTTRISETKAIVETLAAFMCKKEHVPKAIRAEAFVAAAEKGLKTVLEILNEAEDGDWPLGLLKRALAVATVKNVKNYIRKLVCNQIFSGRAVFGCWQAIERLDVDMLVSWKVKTEVSF
ncbi:hypothetical protein PF004_g15534 [Phytophthora fragariae]|uniref:Ankyrin repeat protein n=1 Tax=Phytophthora fragariae TaxID=53985 RepID=A0A6G0NL30_9STRA|nr:hypothetical protein PF004_g15534 [Phytophthora fragariae]